MLKKSPVGRVLIVDDEALVRWSLAETLSDRGYTVTEAADGLSALKAISESSHPFDVVLLDYRLPDSNDLNLLANVRRLAPDSQVIMITAHSSPELIRDATDLGVVRVINKPFELESLATLVSQARATPDPNGRT